MQERAKDSQRTLIRTRGGKEVSSDRSQWRVTVRYGKANVENGEGNGCKIRSPTDAYSAIGTNDDRVVRGGDNVVHVAHYVATRGNLLKRQ
jgi:hypothetical protein